LDVEAIERTGSYNGTYHVLGGVLSPLEGIGQEHLTIDELMDRVNQGEVNELIIALNPTVEGEATTRHIMSALDDTKVRVSRLARGLPTGGDIEYADATTLAASIEGRKTL
jgi:recombination protein RecR